jgi:two-component system cell cycle sensor histidine kinase/response regulator CckA
MKERIMSLPLRVLIIEDSEDDALLMVHALKKGGYHPITKRVSTRGAMMDALKEEEWELIIADYRMPLFSAPEALDLIKRENLEVPFIIVSGAIGEETAVQAMKSGAHDYIMKDNLARLVPAIERELREVEEHRKRKKAEEEKKKMEEQLLQAQKMEAIGRLTGGVAHDFNNLLTAIRGYTDMALDQADAGTQLFQDLREIQISAERAMNLTRQLLLFSRRQPMEFSYIDFNILVENLMGLLHRIIGEDIEVHYHLASDPLVVYADQTSIEQVLMNLVVNARDAMQDGGLITIKTDRILISEENRTEQTDASPGDYIKFSVIDTGTGMDAETQNHIFEPFFSTKEFGKGSGLGLSVVYGIVQQHKGWIHVTSDVDKGSVFEVYLPLVTMRRAEKKTQQEIQSILAMGHGERIMVIEDEDSVRHFAMRALSRGGYTVFTASNEQEAMEVFNREQGNLHLIFSDVVLPNMNGIKLIEKLLILNPEIKVLMSSGYTDQKSQWKIIREKGYPFLQKPYTFETLLRNIHELLK